MNLSIKLSLCVAYILKFVSSRNTTILSDVDLQNAFNFLTTDINTNQTGVAYSASAYNGSLLPLSFYTTPEYFGEYVCVSGATTSGEAPNCTVVDQYNSDTYSISPLPGLGGDLQLERMNTVHGLNIYDASCWQMAMSLGGVLYPDSNYHQLALNVDQFLTMSYSGDELSAVPNANRALTQPSGAFMYGNISINATGVYTDPRNAYSFRMVPRQFKMKDPFVGTKYESYVSFPNPPVDAVVGDLTWQDFKGITGENSWALFIGPLQSAYLREIKQAGKQCVDFNSASIQNAIKALAAVKSLQHVTGGIFYVPAGTLGNTGDTPAPKETISVENNASMLAGLLILENLLKMYNNNTASICPYDKTVVDGAIFDLNSLIRGGLNTAQNVGTQGLYSFFANHALNKTGGYYYTTGLGYDDGRFVADYTVQAVDVFTWTISLLGVKFTDENAGVFGASMNGWKHIKQIAGFYDQGVLKGVGYSDKDGNGITSQTPQSGIMSGEWTLGAITAVRCMYTQYQEMLTTSPENADQINTFIAELKADELSMIQGVSELRSDKYPTSTLLASHVPPNYSQLVTLSPNQLSFMYASKRYFIPFGWTANPISSTTSTAWAIYVQQNFNPFQYGGGYSVYSR